MQREPDPVKVLVAIVPLPLFPLFRSRKLRTGPCCCSDAAIVFIVTSYLKYLITRTEKITKNSGLQRGKYQLKIRLFLAKPQN